MTIFSVSAESLDQVKKSICNQPDVMDEVCNRPVRLQSGLTLEGLATTYPAAAPSA